LNDILQENFPESILIGSRTMDGTEGIISDSTTRDGTTIDVKAEMVKGNGSNRHLRRVALKKIDLGNQQPVGRPRIVTTHRVPLRRLTKTVIIEATTMATNTLVLKRKASIKTTSKNVTGEMTTVVR
jgi:hypothetical protein